MIERADKVVKKLGYLRRLSRRKNNVGVIVGYTANYALYVHENREIWPPGMRLKGKPRGAKRRGRGYRGRYWAPRGRAQPKFLEEPFRENQNRLYAIILQNVKAQGFFAGGAGLDMGLLEAGQYLQRLSQELVPVDTGNLKGSAFTMLVGRG